MKAFRWAILSVCVAAGAGWLGGCGNALEDGSSPSGSVIRVVNVCPSPAEAFTPDIFVSICDIDSEGKVTYEDGLFNSYANVLMAPADPLATAEERLSPDDGATRLNDTPPGGRAVCRCPRLGN